SLAPDQSEIEQADLTLAESEKVSVPGIKEAKIRFECTLESNIELARETDIGTDLIIGKVVQYHIDDALYEDGRIDNEKLQAVSRLAGWNYAKIGDVFSMERPKKGRTRYNESYFSTRKRCLKTNITVTARNRLNRTIPFTSCCESRPGCQCTKCTGK